MARSTIEGTPKLERQKRFTWNAPETFSFEMAGAKLTELSHKLDDSKLDTRDIEKVCNIHALLRHGKKLHKRDPHVILCVDILRRHFVREFNIDEDDPQWQASLILQAARENGNFSTRPDREAQVQNRGISIVTNAYLFLTRDRFA